VFAVGVEREGRGGGAGGVRFAVRVDGREVWRRTLEPARERAHRRWFDERVPLPPAAGREATLELVAAGTPGAGRAGWSGVRLVRTVTAARQPAGPERPSVLVLLVDTLRADALGCHGAAPSPSPTLDRLAAEGRLFTQAVAQAPWTLPSVASILTGLHPRSHGALGRFAPGRDDVLEAAFLADRFETLAEAAARAGVSTLAISANPLLSRGTNLAQGFETFVEHGWDRRRHDWVPAAELNRRFLAWARANADRRFLAWLHYMEPHDPYTPPAGAPPALDGLRPAVARGEIHRLARKVNRGQAPPLTAAELAHLRALYDGEIRRWDDALADLLAGLERTGLRDSTIVVVTADHGEGFQEHGRLTHGSHLYDELLRVPLVLAGPGIAPGRDDGLAQGIDLYPTLARRLGVTVPAGLPGRDLFAPGASDTAFSETSIGIARDGALVELVSLRSRRWKLVHAPARGAWELYDLARDPGEQTDRFGAAPEGDALAGTLAAWTRRAPTARVAPADPALGERLRALGYVP
jgi:arylsulfatase A-like enzyme